MTFSLRTGSIALGVALLLSHGSVVAAEKVYGSKIKPKDVSEAVEACELRLLVEEQTCNMRLNKSQCIKEIHRFCLENADDAAVQEGMEATRAPEPNEVEEF